MKRLALLLPLLALALLAWWLARPSPRAAGAALGGEDVDRGALADVVDGPPSLPRSSEQATDAEARARAPVEAAEAEPEPRPLLVLRGEVVSFGEEEPAPIPGADVELYLGGMNVEQWLARARTGADGGFVFELPRPAHYVPPARPAQYTLVAGARGFLPQYGAATADGETGEYAPVRLRLRRGATLSGRVVDGEGRGVALAEVWLRVSYRSGEALVHRPTGRVFTGGDGGFRMPFPEEALDVRRSAQLVAQDDELGIGALALPDLDALADRDVGEVSLLEPGRIEGVVVDLAGHGVPGCTVEAEHVAALGPGFDEGWRRPRIVHPGGRPSKLSGTARTDADGRFALRGLALGEHVLFTADEDGARARLLPGQHVPTGSLDVRVELRIVTLAFRVLAEDGGRRTGAALMARDGTRWRQVASSQRDGVARFVAPVGEELTLYARQGERRSAEVVVATDAVSALELGTLVLDRPLAREAAPGEER